MSGYAQTQEQTPEDRSKAFEADSGGGNVASGEVLLIQAYAAMWLLAFGLVLGSIRRQRKLDARITDLQRDLQKAQAGKGGAVAEIKNAVAKKKGA